MSKELLSFAEKIIQAEQRIGSAEAKLAAIPAEQGHTRGRLNWFINLNTQRVVGLNNKLSRNIYPLPDGTEVLVKNDNARSLLEVIKTDPKQALPSTVLAHLLFPADLRSGAYSEAYARNRVSGVVSMVNRVVLADTIWAVKRASPQSAYYLTLRDQPVSVSPRPPDLPVSPATIWIQIPQQSREFPAGEIQVTPDKQKIPSEQLLQAGQLLQENINLLLQENPSISPYDLYKAIADWLPGKIPAAIQRVASPETRLYLNMKSVFSAAELCLTDDEEERNEMIQVAVTAAFEAILRHKGDTLYPTVVYNAVKLSLSDHISSRDGIPNVWIRQDYNDYRRIRLRMDSKYFDGRHRLTNRELDGLSRQLAKLAGCGIPAARAFWLYWNSLRNMAVQDEALMFGESDTEQEAMKSLLREDVAGALEVLTCRQREALALYFGIADWRSRTLKEVGEELGTTPQAVDQQVRKGIRKLRSFDQRTHILRSHY